MSHFPIKPSAFTMATNFASAWQQPFLYTQDAISFTTLNNPPMNSQQLHPAESCLAPKKRSGSPRLNKFVRRLHNMLKTEKDSGVVEWRRGLLVLHSTDTFTKNILPKYFNTKNFKTFRRQLNYYGFVHVRSFSSTGTSTTALWLNQNLSKIGDDDVSSVLLLRRVEAEELAKTVEGRRIRKEAAVVTVNDIGIVHTSFHLDRNHQEPCNSGSDMDDDSEEEDVPEISPKVPMMSNCNYEISYETESVSSAPSLTNSSVSSPRITGTSGTHTVESNASTMISTDDAANLLLMFSKSATTSN